MDRSNSGRSCAKCNARMPSTISKDLAGMCLQRLLTLKVLRKIVDGCVDGFA
jgi:hypothetical protein